MDSYNKHFIPNKKKREKKVGLTALVTKCEKLQKTPKPLKQEEVFQMKPPKK